MEKIKRICIMIMGLMILSVGVAALKLSLMGNDSHTAMVLALEGMTGIDLAIILVIIQSIWFIVEFVFGREKIGIGTFVNWIGVGFMVTQSLGWINNHFLISGFIYSRFAYLIIGTLLLSFGVSLYQTADLGIAPYDALSLILSERLSIPYFWCRVFTDVVCVIIAFTLCGIIGLGTLFCSFGLGPIVAFFNKHVSEELL